MAAGKYSFIIEQGATTDFEIIYKSSSGEPISLDGYVARMQLRPTIESDNVILTLSSSLDPDGTGLNLSGSSGTKPLSSGSIGIFISANSSSALDFSEAVYDLELASGSDFPVVTRLLEGKVKLSKNVTLGDF
tara:strand:+ start:1008 stop:1406 length:399 start_codon:yes stop_codon:yes gene_type:complete